MEASSAGVDLPFSHALSAVVFKWGTLPDDLTISSASISLAEVPSSGSCDLQYAADGIAFSWTPDNTTGTYTIENFQGEGSEDETFLMIPHTLSNEEKMKLVFKVGDSIYLLTYRNLIRFKPIELTIFQM